MPALRTPLKVDVIRDRGLPRVMSDGAIENVYRLQVMNTDERPHRFVLCDQQNAAVSVSEQAVILIQRLADTHGQHAAGSFAILRHGAAPGWGRPPSAY